MSANGVLGDPAGANAEEGRALLAEAVDEPRWLPSSQVTRSGRGCRMSRVAVVTGAARGIGAATVRGLAAAGWAVVAVDRAGDDPRLPYAMGSESELHAVVATAGPSRLDAAASAAAERVVAHVADTADPEAMAAAVDPAEERFGGLDAMVAVAGVIAGGVPLWEMPADQLAAVSRWTSVVWSPRRGRPSRPCCAGRPRGTGGSSPWPRLPPARGLPAWPPTARPRPGWPDWCAGLAVDLADSGVTANAVSPGSTAGAMLDESARLYGLETRGLRRPTAHRAPADPRGGGRHAGVAGRHRQRRADRRGDPGGRRPLAVSAPAAIRASGSISTPRSGRFRGRCRAGRRLPRPVGHPEPRRASGRWPGSPADGRCR